jgi:hypothetical protein
MTHHPDNGPSHFFTNLPKAINLEGEYEVGLSEIHINHLPLPFNIEKNEVKFSYQDPGESRGHTFSIPTNQYRENIDLINKLTYYTSRLRRKYPDTIDKVMSNYSTNTGKAKLLVVKEGGVLTSST